MNEKNTTDNIIFNDEELECLSRKLVRKAYEKNASIHHLLHALSIIWEEQIPIENEIMKKVDSFIEYYKDISINGHSAFKVQSFKESLYCMCILVQQKKHVTKKALMDCAKLFSFDQYLIASREKTQALYSFLFERLKFSNQGKPTFEKEFVSYKDSINNVEDYLLFKENYDSRPPIQRTAVAAYWLIKNYF